MAAIATSHLTQALSFLREHPKLACVLLLLLSSPIYRILLYFTPLLLSTALCIFALITLTPYVTATDAEVERQSMLGASSQRKKKTTTTAAEASVSKERKPEGVSGYGKSSSSSSFTSSGPSTSTSSSAAEASWTSWMKGLNDIGRAWIESKLTEQGLALSEPANRETLLAFIEGSFADLMTAQANPSAEVFATIDAHRDAGVVAESAHPMEKTEDAHTESTIECTASEGHALQKSRRDEEVGCASGSSAGGDDAVVMENVRIEETIAVESEAGKVASDVCAEDALEQSYAAYEEKIVQDDTKPAPLLDEDVKVRKQKILVAHESTLPAVLDGSPDTPSATMSRTPSRIPAPNRLLEASRRIFSKEEQNKTMLPRAPLQASISARVNQPSKSPFGSTQSKMERPPSLFKLPARKFLDWSAGIPSKEASKLSTATSMLDCKPSNKFGQGKVKESNVSCVSGDGSNASDGGGYAIGNVQDVDYGVTDVRTSDGSDLAAGTSDNGPRFDEDLEVEEAQALVQSELRMLEVELEEVAAKLPKLDEASAYQKTPVRPIKTSTPSLTPTAASIKSSTTTLFSACPTFKTS